MYTKTLQVKFTRNAIFVQKWRYWLLGLIARRVVDGIIRLSYLGSRDCQSDESWVMTQSWLLRVLTIWAQITVTGSFDQEYCEHRLFVGCLMQIDPRTAVLWRRTCDQEMSGKFQSHFWEMSWEFPQSLLRNESKSNMGLIERKSVNSFNDSAVTMGIRPYAHCHARHTRG